MNKSGEIVFTTDLGSEYSFKDIDGSTPAFQKSFRVLLKLSPNPWNILADYIPHWLKIPRSIYFMFLGLANKLAGLSKNSS